MNKDILIEFSDDTLVLTQNGIERLADILRRPVDPSLWAIKWCYKDTPNGISFHRSHREVREFAKLQIDSRPSGPARLVDVSAWLLNEVTKNTYCWTNLSDFSEAKNYGGPSCRH